MKSVYIAFIALSLLLTGCITTHEIEPTVDLGQPFSVSIYNSNGALSPTKEKRLKEILRYWLPKMQSSIHTFPTPLARIKIEGKNTAGIATEMTVFVGSNWIGDGIGIATLADTQAFTLWNIINQPGANRVARSINAPRPHTLLLPHK